MSEVFISYSRENERKARRIAKRLERLGFQVWWDRKIPAGVPFGEFIQEKLDGAKCVVVLWSSVSIVSEFVKDEAQRGAQRDVLIPALVEEVPLPLGFGRLQTSSLVSWDGDVEAAEFVRFTNSIARMIGRDDLVRRVPEESTSVSTEMAAEIQELLKQHDEVGEPAEPEGPEQPEEPPVPESPPIAAKRGPLVPVLVIALVAALGVAGYLYYRTADPAVGPGSSESDAAPGPVEEPQRPVTAPPIGERPGDPEPESVPEEPSEESPPADPEPEPSPEDGAEQARRTARAQALLESQHLREGESGVSEEDLLAGYEELWNDYITELDPDQRTAVFSRAEELRSSMERFAQLRAAAAEPTLTLTERIRLWQELEPLRPGGQSAVFAAERLAELEGLAEHSATVSSAENFVTCRNVLRENGKGVGPQGVSDEFRAGDVYVFAWVRSPGREQLRLEWVRADGSLVKASQPVVQRNLARGYRIFYSKGFQEPGEYEVRLINAAGHLIARRAFRVTG